jgi:predicted ATPase
MIQTKLSANDEQNNQPEQGITRISVSGYKSLAEECSIEIAPLTILSGANSSGKSSIMQPLLLMKQTLESTYDAGSLKLNGANVRLTSTDQIFTKSANSSYNHTLNSFNVEIELERHNSLQNTFEKENITKGIQVTSSLYKINNNELTISLDMRNPDILKILPTTARNDIQIAYDDNLKKLKQLIYSENKSGSTTRIKSLNRLLDSLESTSHLSVKRYQCFLYVDSIELSAQINFASIFNSKSKINNTPSDLLYSFGGGGLCRSVEMRIRQLIHVPGLRGNPERTYPVSSIGDEFTGTFENYVASIVHYWKITKDTRLKNLGEALQILGLTWKVDTKQIDATQVEVRVGRLTNKRKGQSTDMVSIADVGFGLSQTLPVVVALLVAEPEQLVYLEQPEIHLHPRAQANLAQLLVDAANRGVRVVVETHSELLIRRVQSLIAEDKIAAEKVKLHWFSQDDNGFTKVTTAELDETGAFGDWPEDFSEISLQEESRYLDAAESKLMAV